MPGGKERPAAAAGGVADADQTVGGGKGTDGCRKRDRESTVYTLVDGWII